MLGIGSVVVSIEIVESGVIDSSSDACWKVIMGVGGW